VLLTFLGVTERPEHKKEGSFVAEGGAGGGIPPNDGVAFLIGAIASARLSAHGKPYSWLHTTGFKIFVRNRLDNIPRFIEHLDFRAPIAGALPCVALA
jgi:hypothetical protein